MKKIHLLGMILIFLVSSSIGQTNTFETSIYLGYPASASQIKILDENKYLFCGFKDQFPKQLFLMETDSLGEIIWFSTWDSTGSYGNWILVKKNPFEIIEDNQIIVTYSKIVNDSNRVAVAKFDSNGTLISERVFSELKSGVGNDLCVDDSGNIYIAAIHIQKAPMLLKIDENFNILKILYGELST